MKCWTRIHAHCTLGSVKEISDSSFESRLRQNIGLAEMTTLGIGGPARYFVEANSEADLTAAVRWSAGRDCPLLVLGGGSNLLISDQGFDGLVIKISIRGTEETATSDGVVIRVGAGEEWDALVAYAVNRGLTGIECISGVPGYIGATPIQNVGAYGQEVSETIISVEALDIRTGDFRQFSAAECEFGYRTSRFKTSDLGRYIVTAVSYKFAANCEPLIRYAELQHVLHNRGITRPDLQSVRSAVLDIRRSKGMVIDAADPDSKSAGSFFVNPSLTESEFEAVKAKARNMGIAAENVPVFAAPEGRRKVPAAWLIERSGLKRGYRRGNAGISSKHPLAIVNLGGATAADVIDLADEIKARVYSVFGVELTPEPVFAGFDL